MEKPEMILLQMSKDELKGVIKDCLTEMKPPQPEYPEKMNQRQVADYIGVNHLTIMRWREKEIIPAQKKGTRYVFLKSEIDVALAKNPDLKKYLKS